MWDGQVFLDSCMQVGPFEPCQEPHAGTVINAALFPNITMQCRRLQSRQCLFRAGQPCRALFIVNAGLFKTSVLSEDGRERVTGFHLRGELLGIDSFDMPTYACDAIALDTSEVWELPLSWLKGEGSDLLPFITGMLAAEIRRDWRWMLALGTLSAEQRVVAFLLDLAARLQSLGYSAQYLLLRMTRADLGSFLALQLETVTRALSHLDATGVIAVNRREIRIRDETRLRSMLTCP